MGAGRQFVGAAVVLAILALGTGCVDRRFVVESNVPGAQIYVDGRPIGPAPADAWYTYPGIYEFKAVAPNYQPLKQKVEFKAKWYDYPPLDLFAEVLWPGRIEDVRRVRLELEPTRPVRTDELLRDADLLRARGQSLPPSTVPDDGPTAPPMSPIPPPRVIPPGPPVPPVQGVFPAIPENNGGPRPGDPVVVPTLPVSIEKTGQ